jgi:hypothetical protein
MLKLFYCVINIEGDSENLLCLKDFITDELGCFSFEKLLTSENTSINNKNEINQTKNFEALWNNESTFEGYKGKVGNYMKLKFTYESTGLFFDKWHEISLKFKDISIYIKFNIMSDESIYGAGDLFLKNGEIYYTTFQNVCTDSDGYYIYLDNNFQWNYTYPMSISTRNKINVETRKVKPIEENLIKVDDSKMFLKEFPMHLFPNSSSAYSYDDLLLKKDKVKYHDEVLPYKQSEFHISDFVLPYEEANTTVDDLIIIFTKHGYFFLKFNEMTRQGVEVSKYNLLKKVEINDSLKKDDSIIIDIYSEESKKILHDYLYFGFVCIHPNPIYLKSELYFLKNQ